jgi:hypothetical protein
VLKINPVRFILFILDGEARNGRTAKDEKSLFKKYWDKEIGILKHVCMGFYREGVAREKKHKIAIIVDDCFIKRYNRFFYS